MPLMDTLKAYFQAKRVGQLRDETSQSRTSAAPGASSASTPSEDRQYYGPGPFNTQQALEYLTPEEREAWEKGLPYPEKHRASSQPAPRPQPTARSSSSEDSGALEFLLSPAIYTIGLAALVTVIGSLVYVGMQIHRLLPHWLALSGSSSATAFGLAILLVGSGLAGSLAGWIVSLPFRRAPEVLQVLLMGAPCAAVVPVLITMWGIVSIPNAAAWALPPPSVVRALPSIVSDLFRVSYFGTFTLAVVAAGWAMLLTMARRFGFWWD